MGFVWDLLEGEREEQKWIAHDPSQAQGAEYLKYLCKWSDKSSPTARRSVHSGKENISLKVLSTA